MPLFGALFDLRQPVCIDPLPGLGPGAVASVSHLRFWKHWLFTIVRTCGHNLLLVIVQLRNCRAIEIMLRVGWVAVAFPGDKASDLAFVFL